MPSPEEKARRKALKQNMRQAERDQIRSSLPLSPADLRKLFDYIDQNLSGSECDGTLRNTGTFLEQKQVTVEPVIAWLKDAGGHCDCEVLANAEEKFLFAFPETSSETNQ